MDKYNPNYIEKKWQIHWEQFKPFETEIDNDKEKF